MRLVSTLPRNILHAARKRERRDSKMANNADFRITATARTSSDLERAIAGAMTCMNGTTGSHARAGLAAISKELNARRWRVLVMR